MTPLSRLQAALAEAEVSSLLVSNIDNIRWLTGFTGSYGCALVTPDAGCFVTDSRYTIQAGQQVTDLPVVTFAQPRTVVAVLAEQLAALRITRLALDSETVTLATHKTWSEGFGGCELVPAADPIDTLRMVKTPAEVEAIRRACALADDCLTWLVPRIEAGRRECDLLEDIQQFLKQHGSAPSFEPCVASGPRSALPHGRASDRVIAEGDYVLIDFGARVDGYCSDVTRTWVVGKPGARQQEVYDRVLEAQLAATAALLPGTPCADVDGVARASLAAHGLDQHFGHGLGHGLGLLVHDQGRLAPTSEDTVAAGQVWTVEPGVYIEAFGGVRIEDDVLVTETGPEVLNRFPKTLSLQT